MVKIGKVINHLNHLPSLSLLLGDHIRRGTTRWRGPATLNKIPSGLDVLTHAM